MNKPGTSSNDPKPKGDGKPKDAAADESAVVKLAPSLNPCLDAVLATTSARTGPAVYMPSYCIDVVKVMGEGYSLTAFAGALGVSRGMLNAWCKRYPSFTVAVEQGRAARTRALETQFLTAGTGAKVAAHVFALKNAAPEDWREHPEAEIKRYGADLFINANGRNDARPANTDAEADTVAEADSEAPADSLAEGGGHGR